MYTYKQRLNPYGYEMYTITFLLNRILLEVCGWSSDYEVTNISLSYPFNHAITNPTIWQRWSDMTGVFYMIRLLTCCAERELSTDVQLHHLLSLHVKYTDTVASLVHIRFLSIYNIIFQNRAIINVCDKQTSKIQH